MIKVTIITLILAVASISYADETYYGKYGQYQGRIDNNGTITGKYGEYKGRIDNYRPDHYQGDQYRDPRSTVTGPYGGYQGSIVENTPRTNNYYRPLDRNGKLNR